MARKPPIPCCEAEPWPDSVILKVKALVTQLRRKWKVPAPKHGRSDALTHLLNKTLVGLQISFSTDKTNRTVGIVSSMSWFPSSQSVYAKVFVNKEDRRDVNLTEGAAFTVTAEGRKAWEKAVKENQQQVDAEEVENVLVNTESKPKRKVPEEWLSDEHVNGFVNLFRRHLDGESEYFPLTCWPFQSAAVPHGNLSLDLTTEIEEAGGGRERLKLVAPANFSDSHWIGLEVIFVRGNSDVNPSRKVTVFDSLRQKDDEQKVDLQYPMPEALCTQIANMVAVGSANVGAVDANPGICYSDDFPQ
jgi:hypothetical protein